jgi:hypothetical protein
MKRIYLALVALVAVWGLGRSGAVELEHFDAYAAKVKLSELNVPLKVSDVSGFARRGEICSTGVPLPYGTLAKAEGIAVYSPGGKAVPAQFRVLERWREYGQDGKSIKWLLVSFMADVPAGGQVTYRLKAGKNPAPAKPLSVKDTGDAFVVGETTFKKDLSAPFVMTMTDPEGKQILASAREFKWEVWEAGPLRACIKAESPTVAGRGGLIVWIWSYLGQKRWDVDVVVKNTPHKLMGPLYFRDFSVSWAPKGLEQEKRFVLGGEWGKPLSGSLGSKPAYIFQASAGHKGWDTFSDKSNRAWKQGFITDYSRDHAYAKKGLEAFRGFKAFDAGKEIGAGNAAQGWAALGGRAFVCVRRFRQNYPKAMEVTPGNLTARLWPRYAKGFGGLHWLDDCSRKRHFLQFALTAPDDNHEARARKFDFPLRAHCGVAWYRQTNVIGYLSNKWKSEKPEVVKELKPARCNWVTVGGSVSDRPRRRYHGQSGRNFIKRGAPKYMYGLERGVNHDAGMTPFWVDDYAYPSGAGGLDVPIRYMSPPRKTGKYRPDTRHHGFGAWNNSHFVCDALFDAWRLTGDPLALDASVKVGVYTQFYADWRGKHRAGQTRKDSMPMRNLVEAYRITGDPKMLTSLRKLVAASWQQIEKTRGYYSTRHKWKMGKFGSVRVEAVWNHACLQNGLREYWHVTRDERAFDLMLGLLNYMLEECYDGKGNFNYKAIINWDQQKTLCKPARWDAEAISQARTVRTRGINPGLAWAWLYTGEARYGGMFKLTVAGLKNANSWKSGLYSTPWALHWDETASYANEVKRKAATPPAAVKDLKAEALGGGKVRLTWTAPAGKPVQYQVKHAARPMVEYRIKYPQQKDSHANWWAGKNVKGEPAPKPGRQQMTVEGLTAGKRCFAIRSFDRTWSRSPISNTAVLEVR